MTLIAVASAPDGFAISADGFSLLRTTPPLLTTQGAQKIFSTQFKNRTGFAFAWWGMTGFIIPKTGKRFDFWKRTLEVMAELPEDAYLDTPEDYFGRIERKIYSSLPSVKKMPESYTSDVTFAGFLNGIPLQVEISFPHNSDGFQPPERTRLATSPNCFRVVAGSETVAKEMRATRQIRDPRTLSDSVEMARSYAQTCIDKNKLVDDCKNFSGHVHVATVTPEGFLWVVEPGKFSALR